MDAQTQDFYATLAERCHVKQLELLERLEQGELHSPAASGTADGLPDGWNIQLGGRADHGGSGEQQQPEWQ